MGYTTQRGTKDILPEESPYWQHIEAVSRDILNRYNYNEIRTPIFETTDLFTGSIGETTDIVQKEMYSFTDKGNRQLSLRPEGTASIVRSLIQHKLYRKQKEQKLFYMGPMFRYERPQAGRYRQFHQIGAEHFGSNKPRADAELMALAYTLFNEIGLTELELHINALGDESDRPAIEKLIKETVGDGIKELPEDTQDTYTNNPLRLLESKNKTIQEKLKHMPSIIDVLSPTSQENFKDVCDYLDAIKIPYIIRPTLVRGLDYYTHTVFELISHELGAQNAVCGGGRYNNLVSRLGGPETPAIGFAFGLERTVLILKEKKDMKNKAIDILFMPIGAAQEKTCYQIAHACRQAGLKCEISTESSLKKQLKKASGTDAKLAAIYGEDEANKNSLLIKNLHTREQDEIAIENVLPYLKKHAK